MTLLTLSLKDLRRRPTRSLLTVAGVALAAATLFSLLAFNVGYTQSLKKEMADSGIHMLVSTEGCPMEAASLALHGGEIPNFLPEERAPEIQAVDGVRAIGKILIWSVMSPDGRTDLFYGVEDEFLKLKPHWRIQGSWFKGEDSVVLGAEAARVERRAPGEKIYFPELDAEFTVAGVIARTGSEDDGWFFIPLATAQKLFKKPGLLTGVAVNVSDVEQLGTVREAIEQIPGVYVVTSEQMTEQILKLVGSSKALMFGVLGIALAITAMGVLNTVLMSVMEKLREFGYMRCVGAAPRHLFAIVLVETAALCVAGAALGVAAGAAASSATDEIIRRFLPYAPAGKIVVFEPAMVGLTVLLTVALGLVAGAYPGWRAAHISPMEAARNE